MRLSYPDAHSLTAIAKPVDGTMRRFSTTTLSHTRESQPHLGPWVPSWDSSTSRGHFEALHKHYENMCIEAI